MKVLALWKPAACPTTAPMTRQRGAKIFREGTTCRGISCELLDVDRARTTSSYFDLPTKPLPSNLFPGISTVMGCCFRALPHTNSATQTPIVKLAARKKDRPGRLRKMDRWRSANFQVGEGLDGCSEPVMLSRHTCLEGSLQSSHYSLLLLKLIWYPTP